MKELYTALAKFQGAVQNINLNADVTVTTKSGGKYTFQYATLGEIRDTIRPLLLENGLSVIQKMQTIEGKDYFVSRITHISGQFEDSPLPFAGSWQTSQEFGSLITYYRRYGLVTALGLVAEDDDDSNIASGNSVTFNDEKASKTSKGSAPVAKPAKNDAIKFSDREIKAMAGKEWKELKTGNGKFGPWWLIELNGVKGFITATQREMLLGQMDTPDLDNIPF